MRGHEREREFTDFVAARQTHLRRVAYAVCGDWRALTVAGVLGAAAVLLGTTAVAGGVLDDPAETTPAQFAAMDDPEVVARCAEAENVADANVRRLYGADGTLLARQDFAKPLRHRGGEEVEPLDDYPSLAGEAIS